MELVAMDDGVRLRTWTSGEPSSIPPLIALHGGPGMWDYLEPVAAMVDQLTVVHRFDQRGCGGSDPSGEQTIARLVADVECLRRHWGHERVVVVGHSFGATLALFHAVTHPDAVAAVGYLSGVGIGDWHGPYRAERLRRMSPDQQSRLKDLKHVATRSESEELEYRALAWFTDHADRERAWGWAMEDAGAPYPINAEANRMLNDEANARDDTWLVREVNRRLAAPIMFVHGSGDPRPSSSVAKLAAVIPQARLEIVQGAGHDLWRERPDELRRLLVELVTGQSG